MIKKINMQTIDGTSQNIDKIRALFPNCVTEIKDENGENTLKVDFEQLQQELSSDVIKGNPERYLLTWPGKKAAMTEANRPLNKTLRPAKNESVNYDKTKNLYIEGDNLDALKILQDNYLGKVKMIYIDPPYNTGNDFVYNDNYAHSKKKEEVNANIVDEYNNRLETNPVTKGQFHSDWLSMMYPRLKLARNLLKDDGVIFISIDDHEVHNLRKICDEIFGEENFVGNLSVENNPKGRKNSDFISVSSESLIIYSKNKNKSYFIENVPKKATDMTQDENGNYVHNSGKRVLVGENSFNKLITDSSSDKNYSVYYRKKDNSLILKKENFGITKTDLLSEGYIKYSSYYKNHLVENTYTEKKFKELYNSKSLEFSHDKIYEKNFRDTIRIKSQLVNRKYDAIVRGRKEKFSMELTTTGAGTHLKNLFKLTDLPFNAPKNTGFLKLLISLFEKDSFIILDFFAGSSSTADAVMQLNAEDEGNRKFIMVQLPEKTAKDSVAYKAGYKTIAEIGKERIRRAGKKILEDNASKQSINNLDIGFRVLKIDSSNLKDVYYEPDKTEQDKFDNLINNIKDDRTAEDLLWQVMLECNITLDNPIEEREIDGFKTYFVDDTALIACLENGLSEEYITEIAKLHPLRVAFIDQSFGTDSSKINMSQIFKQYSPNTDIFVL